MHHMNARRGNSVIDIFVDWRRSALFFRARQGTLPDRLSVVGGRDSPANTTPIGFSIFFTNSQKATWYPVDSDLLFRKNDEKKVSRTRTTI